LPIWALVVAAAADDGSGWSEWVMGAIKRELVRLSEIKPELST
jgi:hypothetical protein